MDKDGDIDFVYVEANKKMILLLNNSAPHFSENMGRIVSGSSNVIAWSPGIHRRTLTLDYSIDHGVSWNTIAPEIPDNGTYQLPVHF